MQFFLIHSLLNHYTPPLPGSSARVAVVAGRESVTATTDMTAGAARSSSVVVVVVRRRGPGGVRCRNRMVLPSCGRRSYVPVDCRNWSIVTPPTVGRLSAHWTSVSIPVSSDYIVRETNNNYVIGWWCDLIAPQNEPTKHHLCCYDFCSTSSPLWGADWPGKTQHNRTCREPTFASRHSSDYKSECPKGKPPRHA